jgi:cytochrome oxidase assembly protein ShyY1
MLSRRWALFALVVVLLACGCYALGRWQFHRLHEREAYNAQVRRNLHAAPVPVGDVLAVGRPVSQDTEWRRVTATGTYLPDQSVVIRYQTRAGQSGVDIVTPLRTDRGPAVLVDRGWMQTDNVGADQVDAPAPPAGRVTVQGWVRANATGGAAAVTDRSARAISSVEIARTVDVPLYGGFVDAAHESPAPAKRLVPAELPDLGNGPHFFYGLQWWFFGVLAVFGFFYFAYDERKKGRPDGPPVVPSEPSGTSASDRPEHAPVDRDHRAADEARSR